MLTMTLMEKLSMGGMVALLGIGAVFFILLLLILSIKLVSAIIERAKPVEKVSNIVAVQSATNVVQEDNDQEIAAAISAAIYAIMASENAVDGGVQAEFVIRKIRRIYT